jgi:cytochrome b pre-mRNA-processing protein 3
MLTLLRLWRDRREKARFLYGSIVTQARARDLYTHLGVPDTAEGRFEMLALHLVVVLNRLGEAGRAGQDLARSLTEAFAVDLDDNFREMSVGDLAVPRHVKRAVGHLHERYGSYRAALTAPDDSLLTVAIQSRLSGVGAGQGLDARRICAYIRRARHRLELLPSAEVLGGRIAWPDIRPQAGTGEAAAQDARESGA